MTKAIIVNRNDDVDDDDPVLRNGETLRVPMPFMDSVVSAAIVRVFGDSADSKVLHDGQGGPAGFRPGYAFGGNVPFAHHQRADHARAAYIDAVTTAWKNPEPLPPKPSVAQPVQPPSHRDGGDNGAAHRAYVARISNAWRNPT